MPKIDINNIYSSPEPVAFDAIRIRIASPERLRSWSYGEVTKPETINHRTYKPERDGLFCAKIFGPIRDHECLCGKYRKKKHKGITCEKCGVEVIESKVRRERLGHIELAAPVAHIWFFKGAPSRVGLILDISIKDLERVIYFESYIVIDKGTSDLKDRELISEQKYKETKEKFGDDSFVADMGAEAIRELLRRIDLDLLLVELKREITETTSLQKKLKLVKRLRIVEGFRNKNKPEWMILSVVPVIPPELRPLVALDGGRFATSDLNDLYRRVINRNNRLKKLLLLKAPEIIIRNEKRMLQEAVDALFDNGRRGRAIRSANKRPLKSLSDMIKGKQGRFRQNLLGKRVDYSGRSVIVAGPKLKLHQCGIPKDIVLELFKPFIYHKLTSEKGILTVKQAKKIVEEKNPLVWSVLEDVIKEHPVLLNRAPTLHRLGIQAFEPVLVEGKAILLHPLVCTPFNADFDGDQMAVHVPLSYEAQLEARMLMLSAYNILSPANGRPLAVPGQDIVLGLYYMTRGMRNAAGSGRTYASIDDVAIAYDQGVLDLHAEIKVRVELDLSDDGESDKKIYETTTGRVLLYQILPEGVDFDQVNKVFDKKAIVNLIEHVYQTFGNNETVQLLDDMKDIGYKFATRAGFSICLDDFAVPEIKKEMIANAQKEVDQIEEHYKAGALTTGERYNQIIEIWQKTNDRLSDKVMDRLSKMGGDKSKTDKRERFYNPIYVYANSGARGSKAQISQLSGMRGMMAKPSGEIIETPIIANFREGLTVLEYFTSTHGARKGLADTALKTANSGYLTRRLVDVAQDVIISMDDCGTVNGVEVTALLDGSEVIESLAGRIYGRVTLDPVFHPETGDMVVDANTIIDENIVPIIEKSGVDRIKVRSVLTCDAEFGACKKCYGIDLSNRREVEIGEAVGIIAAQSIGEPGTQLTMRTFHIGGAASASLAASNIMSKFSGIVKLEDVRHVTNRDGQEVVLNRNGVLHIMDNKGRSLEKFTLFYGTRLLTTDGATIKQGQLLAEWDPYAQVIMTEFSGKALLLDVIDGETVREDIDQTTGQTSKVIVSLKDKRKPRVSIVDEAGEEIGRYMLTAGSILQVEHEADVQVGDLLVKMPKENQRTKDITVGLPRVAELFEARRPKDPAVISEIDGIVEVEYSSKRSFSRKVTVTNHESGLVKTYSIPTDSYINYGSGDRIRAGEAIIDGSVDPHDLLAVKGEEELQRYLIDEIQEVYKKQGVLINDKHIEVIVSQMLKRVVVEDPGDSTFMPNDDVYKKEFKRVSEELRMAGKEPPNARPLLQGITKAALNTESFISAASFQETTKVLTDAACECRLDYLRGLKENVIMGRLCPAGTGFASTAASRFRFVKDETK